MRNSSERLDGIIAVLERRLVDGGMTYLAAVMIDDLKATLAELKADALEATRPRTRVRRRSPEPP